MGLCLSESGCVEMLCRSNQCFMNVFDMLWAISCRCRNESVGMVDATVGRLIVTGVVRVSVNGSGKC